MGGNIAIGAPAGAGTLGDYLVQYLETILLQTPCFVYTMVHDLIRPTGLPQALANHIAGSILGLQATSLAVPHPLANWALPSH